MSETTTYNPNKAAERIKPLDIDGVEAYMQPARIEELRHRQQVATLNETRKLPDLQALPRDRQVEICVAETKDYLASAGLNEGDEHYQEAYDYLRSVSADNISHYEWHVDGENPDGTYKPSRGSQSFKLLQKDEYKWQKKKDDEPDEPKGPEEEKTKETQTLANAELEKIQKKYASMLVKRTQKIFERKRSRVEDIEHGDDEAIETASIDEIKNIDQAREVFGDYLNAAATQMMLDLEAQGLDEKQIAVEIDQFINEQTDKFISTFEDMRAATYKKRSPVVRWALKKWASWDIEGEDLSFWQRIKSKENFKNNLKKGAFFAIPGLALGIGVGAVAAPAIAAVGGGALLAGGIGAIIARSVGRNLATHRLNNAANAETIAQTQATEIRADRSEQSKLYDEEYDKLFAGIDFDNLSEEEKEELQTKGEYAGKNFHDVLLESIQERTDYYRKRNRNRFLAGTAISMASGAVGGWIGHNFIAPHVTPHLEKVFDAAGNKIREWWPGSSTGTGNTGPTPPAPSVPQTPDHDATGNTRDPLGPRELRPDGTNKQHNLQDKSPTNEPPKTDHDKWRFGKDESHMEAGEGGFRMLDQMGIHNTGDQAKVWQASGERLSHIKVEVNGRDVPLTYYDNSAHEWRFNMPDNGKVPEHAIRVMADEADKLHVHSNYTKFIDGAKAIDGHKAGGGHHYSAEAKHIQHNEGFNQTMDEANISQVNQPAVLANVHDTLVEDGAAYTMSDGNPGIVMTPDHVMASSTLDHLVDTSHAIDKNVAISGDDVVSHAGIDFHEAVDAASTTSGNNGNFIIEDIGKSYDSDGKAYYSILRGIDRDEWQNVLEQAAPKLHEIRAGGEPLTYKVGNVWHFREIKSGILPYEAQRVLMKIAEQNKFTLAS